MLHIKRRISKTKKKAVEMTIGAAKDEAVNERSGLGCRRPETR